MSITRPIQPLDHNCVQMLEQMFDSLERGHERVYYAADPRHATLVVTRAEVDGRIYIIERRSVEDPFRLELIYYDSGNGNGSRWYPAARRVENHDMQALSFEGDAEDTLCVRDLLSYGALRTYTHVVLATIRKQYRPWTSGGMMQTSDGERLAELARKFPALRGAPGIDVWHRDMLAGWACSDAAPVSGRHAARFVLALEQPEIWPFDVLEAFSVWGASDRAAFLCWASAPWRPGIAKAA